MYAWKKLCSLLNISARPFSAVYISFTPFHYGTEYTLYILTPASMTENVKMNTNVKLMIFGFAVRAGLS